MEVTHGEVLLSLIHNRATPLFLKPKERESFFEIPKEQKIPGFKKAWTLLPVEIQNLINSTPKS